MKRLLAVLLAVCFAVSACDFDVYDLPLPGGADTGSDPLTIHVEFGDVLDLVPESAVKVNDVSVGKVKAVKLVDGHADVTVEVRRDTRLPADTTAQIRQTSLLGEKFVDLVAPTAASGSSASGGTTATTGTPGTTGMLRDGDTIPLARTGRNPEIEEVLGALSLVLNGGGVAQLKTISVELNKALAGHEDAARSVLTQVETLMRNLDDNRSSIVRALEATDRLSKAVRRQEGTIDATLEELPSALRSIDAQRQDLVKMLQALSELGDVGVRVIKASKDNTISVVRNLEPTLTQLANAGDDLVDALDTAPTYPFVDEVVGRDPQVARNLHMGDYVNLSIDLQLDVGGPIDAALSGSLLPSAVNPTKTVSDVLACLGSLKADSKACKDVVSTVSGLLNITNECRKPGNRDAAICKVLNLVPGLPVPGLGGATQPPGSATNPLTDLLGSLGLSRAAPGAPLTTKRAPVSYRELTGVYDPALVMLLVPGLDTATPSAGGGR